MVNSPTKFTTQQHSRSSSRAALSPPVTTSPVKPGSSTATPQPRLSSRTPISSSSSSSSSSRGNTISRTNQTLGERTPVGRPSRPLLNSGKPNSSSTINQSQATPHRTGARPLSLKTLVAAPSSEISFGATTFVSAASGCDENRPPSPSKLRDGRINQSSILAGLGLSRIAPVKSPLISAGGLPNSSDSLKSPLLTTEDRTIEGYDPLKEPIKAYLRIRPPNASSTPRTPYIEVINDTEVLLTPSSQPVMTSFISSDSSSAKYKFTKVFGPETSQQDFFQGTGLPLVRDLLDGKSSLCFAYGVTASGKTYTMQGGLDTVRGGGSMDPGLLPRTMDVLFNSIGKNQTELRIQPSRLTGIEAASLETGPKRRNLSDLYSPPQATSAMLKDHTVLPIKPNTEYGIWVSYAEVYNEKVYDLLDSVLDNSSSSVASFHSFTANIAEQVKSAAQILQHKASSSGGVIKRKALVLKHDKVGGSKYAHGLTEIRVRNAEEAKMLLRYGQVNRTVFSTFANRTSSRSHSIFTIKLINLPKNTGLSESLFSLTSVSRLSIVDLAGSERTRNTQTTGERLKEAGNINKSLMVLGQCMETLRKNQELKERSRKIAIVPFRHSKLTELFQSFFTGEGKTVMIVNVNPCDTGFEENSHVMKFSAVASEVVTVRQQALPDVYQETRKSAAPPLEDQSSFIIEEDDEGAVEQEGETDEVEGHDGFVDHLLDQISMLRMKVVEAEIRAAMIEAEVRDQMIQEYNMKMLEMEDLFVKNLAIEAKEAELKADKKIDIFNRATQRSTLSKKEESETEGGLDYHDERRRTIDDCENYKGILANSVTESLDSDRLVKPSDVRSFSSAVSHISSENGDEQVEADEDETLSNAKSESTKSSSRNFKRIEESDTSTKSAR
ncbi:P-loop containing nucleoside triphosphate hydrolase protein [Phakopsora pachyrhizi]|nr:P-loop containing nucleoside triphosphate hydrolase protein [Phakopsora pachyrhizi]